MSLLNNAKTMGGIGALLTLIGLLVPSFGFLIAIIGIILVFVAVKYISDETKDKSIFNNFLYFFIILIVGIVVTAGIFIITFLEAGGMTYIIELQNLAYSDPIEVWNAIQPLLVGAVVGLIVFWISIIFGVIFLRKSCDKIAEFTNVKWFSTTGLIFLIGAVTVVILIGFLILLIGLILLIIAFFSLPDKLPEKTK